MKMDSARLPLAILATATFLSLSGAVSAAPVCTESSNGTTVVICDNVSSGLVTTGSNPTPASWYSPHNAGGGGTYSQDHLVAGNAGASFATNGAANFGDIIGEDKFDINKITITRNSSSSISFAIKTAYNNVDGSGAKYADIFLDTLSPLTANTWNFAISLGTDLTRNANLPGGTSANTGSNGEAMGLYHLTSDSDYLTSDQVWSGEPGYGIGGLIQPCSPGAGDCGSGPGTGWNHQVIAPATLLNPHGQEVKIGDVSVVVTPPPQNGDGYYTITATVTSIDANSGYDWSIFNSFDVLASSADCANDAMWGTVTTTTVPAPGALALLGFGLLGFGGLRRKARTA